MDLPFFLWAMILILIALCALFFIAVIILLVLPIHLSFELSKIGPQTQGCYKIAINGFTIKKADIFSRSADDLAAYLKKDLSAVTETKSGIEELVKKEKRGIIHMPGMRSLLDAAPALVSLLGDFHRSIMLQKISCRLCFGLDNPVETAIMNGLLWSIVSVLGLYTANISFEPCFEGYCLQGDLAARIKARMLWPAVAVIKSLGDKRMRRLLGEMVGRT
jgi:hypothetical protein